MVQCKQTIIECIKDKLYGIRKTQNKYCDVDVNINSNEITRGIKTQFLGIMIDEQLNWKEQIHQVQTGLSRITGVMYRASHVLVTASLLTLYHSLFLPVMGYCCDIWGNACATNLHCITVLQKKAYKSAIFIDVEFLDLRN